MKFFFTCSLMSFQKYTWIKERQLPNRAQFGGQNPLFCAVSPAGSSSLTCVHCHQFKTRCFHLSGTNAAFESPTDKKSQRIQAVLEAQDPVQHLCWIINFSVIFTQKPPQFYGSTTLQSQDILILSSPSQGLTGPSKDKPLSIIFIEFLW